MKYPYRKTALCIQVLFCVLFSISVIAFFYFVGGASKKYVVECSFGVLGLFVVFYVKFGNEMLNKYVELLDDSIRFNAFRFKDIKMKNAVSFNVNYEDIWSVESKRLPIVGIWAISVNAKNLPHKMTISFCFAKHKELIRNLCSYAKQYNPEAYIDPRVTTYIEE